MRGWMNGWREFFYGGFLLLFFGCEGLWSLEVCAEERRWWSKPFESGQSLRLLNWNVWDNSVILPNHPRFEAFGRIVRALQPDVIGLQEIDPDSKKAYKDRLDGLLTLETSDEGDAGWCVHADEGTDNLILSRFPFSETDFELIKPVRNRDDFYLGQVMARVPFGERDGGGEIWFIVAHYPSGPDIEGRERHSDKLAQWIRDELKGKTQAGQRPVPFVVMGDFNVYRCEPADPAHHLTTLLTGNIIDEETFGPDFLPDWDESRLIEVLPRHNSGGKDFYTWRNDQDRFPPGALDRILYTDSLLEVTSSFVLNTMTMSERDLERSGLLREDVLRSDRGGDYDHLPLIVDFRLIKGLR